MSVAIATLGMFTPARASETTTVITQDSGSSGYGYSETKPKPKVIVQRVENIENTRPMITVKEVDI